MARPDTSGSGYRGSLARRLITVFALAAVVPVLIASGIAYSELMRNVATQQQQSLREQAKSAGMNLLGQLQLVRATLALPAPVSGVRQLEGGLGRIWYTASGSANEESRQLADLSEAQRARLLAGEPVLHWAQGPGSEVELQLLQLDAGTHTLARARLDSERLLALAAASGKDAYIAVESMAGNGMALVHDSGDSRTDTHRNWRRESWILPLAVEFAAPPVKVVIGAPRSDGTSGFEGMNLAIPLTLIGALALAIWLATAQLRRYLGPLDVLTAAARRIAGRDFDVTVDINTGDEFALLGQDFNSMAANLRRQFSTLESVAEVDRLLLRAPTLETILDALLPRIASVLGAERVSVLLMDSESRHHARAFDHGADGLRQLRRIPLGTEGHPVPDAAAMATPTALTQLAAAVFGAVEPAKVRLLNLRSGQETTGVLCLCWRDAEAAGSCDAATLAGFADRLSVALANLTHEQKLIHQARYDGLTGLANRESLATALRDRITNCTAQPPHSALLYIDLDEFKNINDSAGHEAGDCVLVEIAARLQACAGPGDIVARLGGDEFAIAATGRDDPHHASELAERVRRELRRPVTVSGLERRMSASIGIARIPEDGNSVDELLRNADIAMYQAKERGRNQAVAFAPGMLRQMTDRVTLEMELQRALEHDELEMHYQPIVRTDGTIAAEALLRWNRRDGRSVNPAEFIVIAEQSDLILEIGSRVTERVCADLASWQAQGLAPLYVSINVSPRQLHADDFLPFLLDNLDAHGLSPHHIQLELTESSIADGERVRDVIEELSRHGFSIAIDDFGTGYSSLSHLHRYPFSVVKIDRSFVLGIPRSRVAMQLAGTIIRMAHGLDKLVVAEGVETQEQRQALLEFGCDAMQGFLFGRAAPASEFARLLREHENSRSVRLPMATARKTA